MLLFYILAAAFALHGLAHLSGFLASWTRTPAGFREGPWGLPGAAGLKSPIGRAFGVLWLAAAVLLVGASVALLTGSTSWPGLPIAGSIVSLLAILPWLNVVPPGAKVGAVFDLATLLVLPTPLNERLMQRLD
jgi:hypothetical protein